MSEILDKSCFVIAPIGGVGTETRRKIDGLVTALLRPVLEPMGFSVVPAHEISESGSITNQIVQRLLEADLVIADLTGLNPNVMYELAVRHAKRRPVVTIKEEGTDLPFDLAGDRTLDFRSDHLGIPELTPKLKAAVELALLDDKPDNPIYRAAAASILQLVTEEEGQRALLARVGSLTAVVERLVGSRTFQEFQHSGTQPLHLEVVLELPDGLLLPDLLDDLEKSYRDRLIIHQGRSLSDSSWVISMTAKGMTRDQIGPVFHARGIGSLSLKEVDPRESPGFPSTSPLLLRSP